MATTSTTTNYGWVLPNGWLTDMNTTMQAIDTNLLSATTTLVGGTKAVTITGLTTGAVVLYNRTTAGGTLGHLSYAATTNTLTFNSSNVADTSVISYIVLKY